MRNFWLIVSVLWLWTRSGGGDKATGPEEPPIVINLTSLGGQAQKGPFNNGTAINIAELTNTLSPTGRNFSSAITDNTGRFSVANVELESPYVELRANGYYFNEVSNEISSGQLTLFALSNLTGKTSLNVNILTHLEKNRMVTLMSGDNPKTFAEAKIQAQEEVLAIFDYSRADVPESELLDISQSGAANAKLLAMSAIIQGDLTVGQMSQLLANMSTDIASDGTLDDTNLRNTLIENSKNLDIAEVRSHLEAHYSSLGVSANIADFETEVNQFLKPPEAQDISASIAEDTQINITLAGSDPEGESLTYTIYEVNNATVTLNGDVANYTPNANFYGTDTFKYYANDGTSDSNIATVTMTVSAEDDDPNTLDVSTTTDEDIAVVVNLSAEEYDGDSYSFTIIDQPNDGSVSLNGASATYTPNQDWNGEDTFTFEATDDAGRNMNVATATITVNAINDAPVMIDTTFTFEEDNCVNGGGGDDYCLIFDPAVLTSDIDGGSSLRWTMVTEPENGEAFVSSGQTTYYNANANFYGTDYFTLTANDGELDSNVATITIIFTPVNDAPVANDVSVSLNENRINGIYQPVTITLEATDVEEDDLTYSIVGSPTYGTLGSLDGTQIVYTPNQDYNGEDSFTYKANDGQADSNIATVNITINSVNDVPIAYPTSVEMNEDDEEIVIDLIAIDPDGNSINSQQYSFVTSPSNSSYIWGLGAHYFDIQTVTVSDDNSYVDIKFNNPLGSGDGDLELRFAYSSEWSHIASSFDDEWVGLDNFDRKQNVIDHIMKFLSVYPWVDSHDKFKALFTNTVNTLYPMKIYWSPGENINGTEVWSYTVSDGQSTSDAATITVNINPINDIPVVYNASVSGDEDVTSSVGGSSINGFKFILPEATDVESGSSDDFHNSLEIVTLPTHGKIYSNNNEGDDSPENELSVGSAMNNIEDGYGARIWYVQDTEHWNGTDTFTYKANDGEADSNTATVTITVNPVNDKPTAVDVSKTMDEDGGTIEVETNYNDIDGDTDITFTLVNAPANGTATVGVPGTYTPNANFHGTDTFTYTVSDGEYTSDTASVTITINPIDDLPTAIDLTASTAEDVSVEIPLEYFDAEGDVWSNPSYNHGNASNGLVTLNTTGDNPGTIAIYTPNAGFFGSDSFTYSATGTSSVEAVVTIEVSEVVGDLTIFPDLTEAYSERFSDIVYDNSTGGFIVTGFSHNKNDNNNDGDTWKFLQLYADNSNTISYENIDVSLQGAGAGSNWATNNYPIHSHAISRYVSYDGSYLVTNNNDYLWSFSNSATVVNNQFSGSIESGYNSIDYISNTFQTAGGEYIIVGSVSKDGDFQDRYPVIARIDNNLNILNYKILTSHVDDSTSKHSVVKISMASAGDDIYVIAQTSLKGISQSDKLQFYKLNESDLNLELYLNLSDTIAGSPTKFYTQGNEFVTYKRNPNNNDEFVVVTENANQEPQLVHYLVDSSGSAQLVGTFYPGTEVMENYFELVDSGNRFYLVSQSYDDIRVQSVFDTENFSNEWVKTLDITGLGYNDRFGGATSIDYGNNASGLAITGSTRKDSTEDWDGFILLLDLNGD